MAQGNLIRHWQNYLVGLLIIGIGFFFHWKTLNEFPKYKHNWAQCDRHALAVGFVNNGGDFFHPQTYVLNKQFPGHFEIPDSTGITAVDFPIHDYIVSLIMRIFNSTSPWCFRLYVLLYSMVGLLFLYRLACLFTPHQARALGVVLFAALSPTFLYYQSGFLPTLPSLANTWIALFFFFKFLHTQNRKQYACFIFFITLAALARLPFLMVLVAIMCMELIDNIKHKRLMWFKWWYILLSLTAVVIYYLYNSYLRSKYGSLFLNHLMPASHYNEFIAHLNTIYNRWIDNYFSSLHYLLLFVLAGLFIITLITKNISINTVEKKLAFFIFLLSGACVLYVVLMIVQFLYHDYYFLDTFYIPMVCLFLWLVTKIPEYKSIRLQNTITAVLLVSFIPVGIYAKHLQDSEKASYSTIEDLSTVQSFKNAAMFLDTLGIPKHANILVMEADGANNPFLLLKRKGYIVIETNAQKIEHALHWPYDYVVLENSKLPIIYNEFPEIIHHLHQLASNGSITVYNKSKINNRKENIDSFLNLGSKQMIYHQFINFDGITENYFNTDSLSNYCFSGTKAGLIMANQEYGATQSISHLKALKQHSSTLVVKSMINYKDSLHELLLCANITHQGNSILFLATDIGKHIQAKEWSKQTCVFNIPKLNTPDVELAVFIWNRGKNKLFYDDFEVTLYQ